MKINQKRPGLAHFFKKTFLSKHQIFIALNGQILKKIVSSSGHTGCNECVIQMGTQASVSEEVGAWR